MNPYRPGSRVARAYDVYCRSGPEETLRIGLGEMGLKEGTLRGWLRMWSKKPKAGVSTKPNERRVIVGRKDPVMGTVTEPGKEQSGVRLDDGLFIYIPNHWLREVDEDGNPVEEDNKKSSVPRYRSKRLSGDDA